MNDGTENTYTDEDVREVAEAEAGDEIDFYTAALDLGFSVNEAELIAGRLGDLVVEPEPVAEFGPVERDESIPLDEQVRELADKRAKPDDWLDFYNAARDLGVGHPEAEAIDERLNLRVMRSRGAI
jgi:hypothetical protein